MIRGRLSLALTAALLFLSASSLKGQASHAAEGPGSYIAVGAVASGFQADYGRQRLGGVGVFIDANFYRRVGIEAEYRSLSFHSTQSLSESSILVGPRVSTHGRDLRPYAKLLVGRGHLSYPYNYAQGSYFAIAPGAGLDWRIGGGPVSIRVIDFEYQLWPQFTFGTLHPYGISTGVSLRIF